MLNKIIFNANNLKLIQILIVLSLTVAFALELIFNLKPCEFCIWQRLIWTVFLLITLIMPNIWLMLIILFTQIGVSSFQVVMQYGFISYSCPIDFDAITPVSCSIIDFSVFGISLAGYNLIFTFIIVGMLYKHKIKRIIK